MKPRAEQLDLALLRRKLLRWYIGNKRPMPWRVEPGFLATPYSVLVSETMLQQTQVTTVVPYFEKFMARFPDVASLAEADEQEVLQLWQGLGYYRRARLLYRAAGQIIQQHGGVIPTTADELIELAGVGRYTAGAVASIAFGRPEPVVDGNVARVVGRLLAAQSAADSKPAMKVAWGLMDRLVDIKLKTGRYGPGDLNQAVMELGATLCIPGMPRCGQCPLADMCQAHQTGEPGRYGAKAAKAAPRAVSHFVLAVGHRGRWLFEQRPERGLWAGMWQLPTLETGGKALHVPLGTIQAWGQSRDLEIREACPIGEFVHITTHRAIRFWVCRLKIRAIRNAGRLGTWRRLMDVHDLPMSNAQKRALSMVKAFEVGGEGSQLTPPKPGSMGKSRIRK